MHFKVKIVMNYSYIYILIFVSKIRLQSLFSSTVIHAIPDCRSRKIEERYEFALSQRYIQE